MNFFESNKWSLPLECTCFLAYHITLYSAVKRIKIVWIFEIDDYFYVFHICIVFPDVITRLVECSRNNVEWWCFLVLRTQESYYFIKKYANVVSFRLCTHQSVILQHIGDWKSIGFYQWCQMEQCFELLKRTLSAGPLTFLCVSWGWLEKTGSGAAVALDIQWIDAPFLYS